ncbi:MAG: EamA family transporter [Anaerolineales bacterium]|nr:EamA family transporter [Anaerolineales bacterium]
MAKETRFERGVPAAVASAISLGLCPIFGKQAINAGMLSLAVVASRTVAAAALLFLAVLLFRRRYLYIYPIGLVGCLVAGAVNGIGSLFFYAGLARVDASLGQLLYSLYPVFVAVLLYLDGLRHTKITFLSLALCLPAVFLLTQASTTHIDIQGVVYMLTAGFLYAVHIPINQRVLYEAPAPTVTLYTLFAMTIIVVPAQFIFSTGLPVIPSPAVVPLVGLTLVTFLSRVMLFTGVKSIGGMRTSLLGLAELLITVGLAHLWLGESLATSQWVGASLLFLALVLAGLDRPSPPPIHRRGWLGWLRPRFKTLEIPEFERAEYEPEAAQHERSVTKIGFDHPSATDGSAED